MTSVNPDFPTSKTSSTVLASSTDMSDVREASSESEYVQIPGLSDDLIGAKPIPLREEHIQEIVNTITYVLGPTEEARDVMLEQIVEHLWDMLESGEHLTPDGFEDLKKTIVAQYDLAVAKRGSPIGLPISEAFIATVMQSTLNTFHKAGTVADTGFDATREIMYLPPRRKTEQTFIHFKRENGERFSRRDIFDLRREIVNSNVSDMILDFDINTFGETEDFWWAEIQREIADIEVEESTVFLRLHLDVPNMIAYHITPADIVDNLMENKPNLIKCIYSPLQDGILDIYARDEAIADIHVVKQIEMDTDYRFFFLRSLVPEFPKMRMHGIPGVNALYPSTVKLLSGILSSVKLNREQLIRRELSPDKEAWLIRKNIASFLFSGLTNDMYIELFEHPEIDIRIAVDSKGNRMMSMYEIMVHLPERAPSGMDPAKWIASVIEKFRKLSVKPEDPVEEDPIYLQNKKVYNEIVDLSEYHYAIAYSASLRKILALPYVDRNRTYCNNFHVMCSVFGVEAARNYHLYNSLVITNASESINSRYITAFSDISIYRGIPAGITFTGIVRQSGDWLSIGTVQEPQKVFSNAAIYNRTGESVKSVSTGISVGTKPFIGTGAYEDFIDWTQPETIPDNVDIDLDDLENALNNLTDEQINLASGPVFDSELGDEIGMETFNSLSGNIPNMGNIRDTKPKPPSMKVPVVPPTGLAEILSTINVKKIGPGGPAGSAGPGEPEGTTSVKYVGPYTTDFIMTLVPPPFSEGLPMWVSALMKGIKVDLPSRAPRNKPQPRISPKSPKSPKGPKEPKSPKGPRQEDILPFPEVKTEEPLMPDIPQTVLTRKPVSAITPDDLLAFYTNI